MVDINKLMKDNELFYPITHDKAVEGIERGTFESGTHYIKYSDGFTILFKTSRMSTPSNIPLGSSFRNVPEQWVFDIPFKSVPTLSITVVGGVWFGIGACGTTDVNAVQTLYTCVTPTTSDDNPIISLVAYGWT